MFSGLLLEDIRSFFIFVFRSYRCVWDSIYKYHSNKVDLLSVGTISNTVFVVYCVTLIICSPRAVADIMLIVCKLGSWCGCMSGI